MNTLIECLNRGGMLWAQWAAPMFWQSCVLVLLLFGLDYGLRRWVRAGIRYGLWMLLLVKLVLPPSLALPTGVGQWWSCGVQAPAAHPVLSAPRVSDAGAAFLTTPIEVHAEVLSAGLSSPVAAPRPLLSAPLAPARVRLNGYGWALALWLTGAVGGLGLYACRSRLVMRAVAAAAEAPAPLRELLEGCRRRLGAHARVSIRVSREQIGPAVCGAWRPTILMPEPLPHVLSEEHMRAVLLHELAHVRRHDVWVNYVQAFLQAMYFYHPLLWLAQARIRQVREQAADEVVLVAMGEAAEEYPAALLAVARAVVWRPRLALGLAGALESRGALRRRIQHILDRPLPARARLGLPVLVGLVWVGLWVLPMASTDSQAIDDAEPTELASRPAGRVAELAGSQTKSIVPVRVRDYETGKPMAGARVWVNGMVSPGRMSGAEALTDEEGRCELKLDAGGFDKLGLTVLAEGYRPLSLKLTPEVTRGELALQLRSAGALRPWEGKLLTPEGQPAASARGIVYPDGCPAFELRPIPSGFSPAVTAGEGRRFKTDGEGRFACPSTFYDGGILFVHPTGYLKVRGAPPQQPTNLALRAWAKVEGELRIGPAPGPRQTVVLWTTLFEQPDAIGLTLRTDTDEQGRFHFDCVPAGPCYVGRVVVPVNRYWAGRSQVARLEGRAGETARIRLGGVGRPVVGRLVAADPPLVLSKAAFALVRQTGRVWTVPATSPLSRGYFKRLAELDFTQPKYYLEVQADGSFRVEDVPPGDYRVVVNGLGQGQKWLRRYLFPEPKGRRTLPDEEEEESPPEPDGLPTVTAAAVDTAADETGEDGMDVDVSAPLVRSGGHYTTVPWELTLAGPPGRGECTNRVVVVPAAEGRLSQPMDVGLITLGRLP